jgi:hypothetical protein
MSESEVSESLNRLQLNDDNTNAEDLIADDNTKNKDNSNSSRTESPTENTSQTQA